MAWVIIGIVCLTIAVLLAAFAYTVGNLPGSLNAKDRRVLYLTSLVVYAGGCYVIISNICTGY